MTVLQSRGQPLLNLERQVPIYCDPTVDSGWECLVRGTPQVLHEKIRELGLVYGLVWGQLIRFGVNAAPDDYRFVLADTCRPPKCDPLLFNFERYKNDRYLVVPSNDGSARWIAEELGYKAVAGQACSYPLSESGVQRLVALAEREGSLVLRGYAYAS